MLNKDGNVTIKIQAKPGAKCNNVTGNKKYYSTNFIYLLNFYYKEYYSFVLYKKRQRDFL